MRILHTADWHIGRNLSEFSLLDDQRYIFQQIFQIIQDYKIDVLIVAGDLYNRSMPSADSVAFMDEIFSTLIRLGVKVLGISGNHDSSRLVAYGSHFFEQCGLYLEGGFHPKIREVTLQDEFGPLHFWLLPYFVPHEVKSAYLEEEIRNASSAFQQIIHQNSPYFNPSERNILVAHGFYLKFASESIPEDFPTYQSGSETSVGTSDLMDISPASDFDYIALGHIHSCKTAGCDTIRYSGSPLKYSISEAQNPKYVLLVDVQEKGNISISQIPLTPKRDLRIISGSMDQLLNPQNQAGYSLEDYIYANIISDGPILNAMGQLRSIFPNALGLSFHSNDPLEKEIAFQDTISSIPLDQLFQQFYQDVWQEELSDNRKMMIQQIANSLTLEDINHET